MSEWKKFVRFVQAKAGESPCICGIGAGNSMAFLRFDGQDILQNSGKVSHEVAGRKKNIKVSELSRINILNLTLIGL